MSANVVIVGILQVHPSDKVRLCKQQWVVWTLGDAFKMQLAARFLIIAD